MIIYILIVILFICTSILVFNLCNTSSNTEHIIYFDSIHYIPKYLINLDHRQDRLKITTKLLNDYGFDEILRYPAVNGKHMSNNELEKIVAPHAMTSIRNGFRKEHHELSHGAVGCSLSHINIWKKFNDSSSDDNDMIIIFEDDTRPSFTIKDLHEFLKHAPTNWDIVFFGGEYHTTQPVNEYITKLDKFYRTHGYIIRKKCIPFLLQHAFPIEKQIDSWLSDLASDHKIHIYGITKNDWKQNDQIAATDIQTPIS